jgi:hypothetical protein
MAVTAVTPQQAVNDIEDHIRKSGGLYSTWYCGVATDPVTRLFTDHGVRQNGDYWIYRQCADDAAARRVEQYFLAKGCKGAPGGGDTSSRHVYAYKITSHSRE